jgi:hypothetical protein
MKMNSETVDAINKSYGQYKDEVVSLSDEDFKTFSSRLMDRAKTEKEPWAWLFLLSQLWMDREGRNKNCENN